MRTFVLLLVSILVSACSGTGGTSSTVTVGGRQVDVPDVTAD